MDPLVTPKATLTRTLRATKMGTPKKPGTQRSTTHIDIKRLSPGIYSSSSLVKFKKSVTPERITTQKRWSQISDKLLTQIKRLKYTTPNNYIHLKNNQTMIKHKV